MRGEHFFGQVVAPLFEALEARLLLDGLTEDQAIELFSVSPALFVENQGQWTDESVRYVHQGNGANVAMTDSGPVFQVFRQEPREGTDGAPGDLTDPLDGDRFDPDDYDTEMLQFSAAFVGASTVSPVGLEPSATVFNYLLGEQENWRSQVPAYEVVAYEGLYEGVDLYAWGQRDSLKYEFRVAPGADWSAIQVRYDGIEGLALAADGSLRVALGEGWGEVADDAPLIYQDTGGERVDVAGRFRLLDQTTYAFEVTGPYDPSRELVMDPDLAWLTYLGGSGTDEGFGIAVDASGNAYVTGETCSAGLATPGAFDTTPGGDRDAFVAKVNASGTDLAYFTYLGGSGFDWGRGIAVDASGSAYVTGYTYSAGLATPGAFDTTYGGNADPDAFVAKVNASGTDLAYFTYLGGSSSDRGHGIAVDASGSAYVTGITDSAGLATPGAFDTTYGGNKDAFVARVNASGTDLAYFTYLGGSGGDYAGGIALDASGSAYVTGGTESAGLATPGAFDTTPGGDRDAFVARVNASGTDLAYFTYLGGSGDDYGGGIALDASGSGYVTGYTYSAGLATPGALDTTYGGHGDAFVAKVDASGTDLEYFTYLGGSDWDDAVGIAVDSSGAAYVTGITSSAGLATPGAFDTTLGSLWDAFVAKVNASGTDLAYFTYLGGSGSEYGEGIAVDASGNAYVTGATSSAGLATPGAFDTTCGGHGDAFVAKFSGLGEPQDAGDRLAAAANLGTLAAGSSVVRAGQVGDGPYGSKDVDLFRFTLATGGAVTLDVDARATGSTLDPYLRLFDSAGRQVAANDDTDGLDPYLSVTLAGGTYYVGVSGYANRYYNPNVAGSGQSGSTGPYSLAISVAGTGGGTWTPMITAAATYDGNPAPAAFGRYMTGDVVPDVWNTFAAYVAAPAGFTTSAVAFDANFNGVRDGGDWTDSSSSGGWTWNLNVSDLAGDKTLRIWARESGGAWSDEALFAIDTLAAPGWMDPDLTTIDFDTASGRYEIESLIGKRFGVYTPTDWPEWLAYRDGERTFNGIYYGTLVEASCSLSGQVQTDSVAPAFGWSVFGAGQTYRAPIGQLGSHFSVTVDLFRFIDLWTDPAGYFAANQDPRANGSYDRRRVVPTLTISYDGHAALDDDLAFTQYQQTFSVSLETQGTLFEIPIPPVVFPLWAPPDIALVLTPHVGFGPYFDVSYTQVRDGSGQPHFQSASAEIGVQGEVGVTGEVSFVGGFVKGGVDVTGSVSLGFQAEYDGSWTYSIPVTLGVDIDFVGSILWGLFSGSIDVYDWETTGDLWSSGAGAAGGMAALAGTSRHEAGAGPLTLVDADMARASTGDIAYAWALTSQDGTASPLKVQRMTGGAWQAPETLVDTDFHRGTPSIASLGGDRWMALWSQNNLPTPVLGSLTGETIVSQQEIWYALYEGGGWGAPVRLTTNSTCDDSPEAVVLGDGRVVAAWRHMSGLDTEDISGSDLVFAVWDGAAWSAPAALADTAERLSRPAVAVLPDDEVVAVWLSDAAVDGSEVTVWSSAFDGALWSTPVVISDGPPGYRDWANVAGLPDGTALAPWTEESDEGARVMSARRDTDGLWSATEPVTAYQPVVGKPEVAVAGNAVHIVYHGYEDENEVVGLSRDFSAPTGQWSAAELLTPEAGDAWWPFVEVDAANQAQIRYVLESALTDGAIVPMADLSLSSSDVTLGAAPAEPGVANTVRAAVANDGWSASNATAVALYDGDPAAGGTLLGTEALPGLAVGASEEVTFDWTPGPGSHELWVVVDPDGTEPESHEDNNTACFPVAALMRPTAELDPASDSGTVGDNRTADTTPTVVGATDDGTTVHVYLDSLEVSAMEADVTGGAFQATLPLLANGYHTVWARAYDGEGNPSALSDPLLLHIEAAPLPTPAAPGLSAGSDSGIVGDGKTNVVRPVIVGSAKPLTTVEVYDGAVLLGEVAAAADGVYSLAPGVDLAEGSHEVSVVQADEVGHVSDHSDPLVLVVDTAGPSAVSVELNDREGRTVSDIEPSGIGVRTIDMTFSETLFFDPAAVVLKAVEFSTGAEVETPGVLPAVAVTGSGTNVMTITLGDPAGTVGAVDTWVKVTLDAAGITDAAGNPLDGDPRSGIAGRGYIFDSLADLPSGDGLAGGDAVFYVGSLRADLRGFGPGAEEPNGTVDSWDINGFTSKYLAGDLDADFRGFGPVQEDPNGTVDSWDINGFTSRYIAAIAAGTHLDDLPTAGGQSMAADGPALLPPETALLARQRLGSQGTRDAPGPTSSELVSLKIGELAATHKFRSGLTVDGETWTVPTPALATEGPAEASAAPALVPDAGVPDLLALSALDVRL